MAKWLVLLLLLANTSVAADEDWGDDDWGDESEDQITSAWQYSGFFALSFGDFTADQPLFPSDHHSLAELRSRVSLSYTDEQWLLNSKAELYYDQVLGKTLVNLRELNLSTSPTDNLDIKVGRQILTWGTGDYLFLNDLFAKDWQAFFSGRADQYLKAPSNSLKVSYYFNELALDLAWTPKFTADNYLNGERFSFYSPHAQAQVAPAGAFKVIEQDKDQWAARLSTSKNGVEYALYGYHGYWNTPQGQTAQGMGYFPQLNSWGISVRSPLADGLFNAEYASYNADKSNPMEANGQHRLLLGYEQEAAKNFTLSAQWYLEKTKAYQQFKATSIHPAQVVDQYRQLLTLRARYTAMAQKLNYSLFVFYSPSDHDSYLRPSISYRQDDQWHYSAGANLFAGKHHYSFFAQHQDNSNVWLTVKYSW